MKEKPLHVRVAAALGDDLGRCPARCMDTNEDESGVICHDCDFEVEYDSPRWRAGSIEKHDQPAARYDEDWSATGPLIEKYGITIESPYRFIPSAPFATWSATASRGCDYPHYADPVTQEEAPVKCSCVAGVEGATPLVAVCNLILALAAAGKLK